MDAQNESPHDDVQTDEDELSEEELEQITGGLSFNPDVMPFGPGPSRSGGVPMPLPASNEPGGPSVPSAP